MHTIYDDALYQIAIRKIYEAFSNDDYDNIERIVFTGWVECNIENENKKEPEYQKKCIMSVVTERNTFMSLGLEKMNAKALFSKLDGVVEGKLYKLNAVTPYLTIDVENNPLTGRAG